MEFGYVQFINPDFMDEYAKVYTEQLRASGASEQQLADASKQLESFSWMRSAVGTGAFYFAETFLIGVVGAMIMAAFMRKRAA